MRTGIDGRLMEETGVGRYIRNLVRELAVNDHTNEYVVFLRKKSFDAFKAPNSRWRKVLADVAWHTVTEQIFMPRIFQKEKLDLLHVPYFNVPVLYRGPFIMTVHDLTIMHFDTGKASTRSWIFYKFRRAGYRIILRWGILHAKHLIAVSKETKKEIIDHFSVAENKITVTYEGVDKDLRGTKPSIIREPYFLYVGNAYPHKNLETFLEAFQKIKGDTKLVLVGKDDFFYQRIRNVVADLRIAGSVIFFGAANDGQLASLYQHAIALVFPSLMEGFGLPALEARSFGCPVICSDIPIFHELLGDEAVYFDPKNSADIAHKLLEALREGKEGKSESISRVVSRFSWEEMAKKTIDIYERSLSL